MTEHEHAVQEKNGPIYCNTNPLCDGTRPYSEMKRTDAFLREVERRARASREEMLRDSKTVEDELARFEVGKVHHFRAAGSIAASSLVRHLRRILGEKP